MLYAASFLAIRGTAPFPADRFFAGEYYDANEELVGCYAVFSPAGNRWREEPAISVTDVCDRDGTLFMRILRRPLHVLSALAGGNARRGQYVIVDTDDVPVATLWPRLFLNGNRLRVRAAIESYGGGELVEEALRHEHGARIFPVRADDPPALLATITWQYPSKRAKRDSGEQLQRQEIRVEQERGTPAAWRCTTLALATCLPQFGIGSAVVSDGSG